MPNPKVDEAVTIALEAIRDAAPGLLTMTEVAEKVASNASVTISTARNWLRAACEAGSLLELTPWSRKFVVELPGAGDAGVGPFYVAREATGPRMYDIRHVLTTDDGAMRPSSYGPGRTTYLVDPQQAREYVQELADQKKAKEEAEHAAFREDQKAQRKEIGRRFPGLSRALRQLVFLGSRINSSDSHDSMATARAYLDTSRHQAKDAPVEERNSNLTIMVEGDANVAMLHSILTAGISAHLADQPLTLCKHCGGRILRTAGDRQWWWHVETTNASCAEGDTKAEPALSNVPRETSTD